VSEKNSSVILRKLTLALLVFVSLNANTHANAANVFRVDDSASQPIEAQSQLRWKSLVPRGADANEVETTVRVNIKLDVRQWQGRRGRIYMALPPVAADALKVEWTTQGRLQPGRLIAGGRGLVYQGPISSQMLEDVMSVQINGDGRRISSPQRLQFYFEIEPE
jgi:hypothetical protein